MARERVGARLTSLRQRYTPLAIRSCSWKSRRRAVSTTSSTGPSTGRSRRSRWSRAWRASLDETVVSILGGANRMADGFSMAVSNFLGSRAECQQRERARRRKGLSGSRRSWWAASPRCSPTGRVRSSRKWREPAAQPPAARGHGCATLAGLRSSRRSSCALSATTIVERLIRSAPTAGGMVMPHGASTPAASGIASTL